MQERCVFAHYCAAHAMLHAFIEAADWERGQGLLDNHGRMPQKLFLPFGDVLNVGDGLLRAKSAKLLDTHISNIECCSMGGAIRQSMWSSTCRITNRLPSTYLEVGECCELHNRR